MKKLIFLLVTIVTYFSLLGLCTDELECCDNEVVDDCPANCLSDYCPKCEEESQASCPVPKTCPEPACKCRFNYRRECENGPCIPTRNCSAFHCSGKNEEFNPCPPYCPSDDCSQASPNGTCPLPGRIGIVLECKPACRCKKNYWRKNGICVPYEECAAHCDGKNEVYDSCPPTCPPKQTCDIINKTYHCPLILDGSSSKNCNGTCRCKPGYYRNILNECISEVNCLKCNGSHEYFSCGGACDNVCSKLKTENQTNCPVVNFKCNEKCYCKEGYARDTNNTCIPIDQCKEPCGKNEVYNECPAFSCKALNCSQLGYSVPCPFIPVNATCPSEPACICKDGYLRNKKGICVPENECPCCGGDPNAKPGCGQNCGKKCSNYNKKAVVCAAICKVNGCDCKPGYVYDDNIGKCVRPKECTPVCKSNEIYSSCIQSSCRPENCTQLGQSIPCPRIIPKYCIKGCLCKEGYLRHNNGTCIPEKKCPKVLECCDNEVVDDCPANCPSDYCPKCEEESQASCPVPKTCPEPACKCRFNYRRECENGPCIPTRNCSAFHCTGKNEEFNPCPPFCPSDDCSQASPTGRCPLPGRIGIVLECKPACRCKKNYWRKNGICVPYEECDKKCGPNEEFKSKMTCPPESCLFLLAKFKCDSTQKPVTDCYCKSGFLRKNNTEGYKTPCIPTCQCPDGPDCNNGTGI